MKKVTDTFVSAVIVADEYIEHVEQKVKDTSKVLKSHYTNYEVVVVDNGLSDGSRVALKKMLPKVSCIRIIKLSKVEDTDTAIFAGIEAAIGDVVGILYNNDPVELLPEFINELAESEIVFGVANNVTRKGLMEKLGAKIFYWYSKRYLKIDIPNGSTYFIVMNRNVANAVTRSGRYRRHIRHIAKQVGFTSKNFTYELPQSKEVYAKANFSTLFLRAIDLVSSYSSHPLRILTYFGVLAGLLNLLYAIYVILINLSGQYIERGWTSLSLQSSAMFFLMFMVLAILAEYIGKILNEVQHEPPYHIMNELSSTISVADETRRNVTK